MWATVAANGQYHAEEACRLVEDSVTESAQGGMRLPGSGEVLLEGWVRRVKQSLAPVLCSSLHDGGACGADCAEGDADGGSGLVWVRFVVKDYPEVMLLPIVLGGESRVRSNADPHVTTPPSRPKNNTLSTRTTPPSPLLQVSQPYACHDPRTMTHAP